METKKMTKVKWEKGSGCGMSLLYETQLKQGIECGDIVATEEGFYFTSQYMSRLAAHRKLVRKIAEETLPGFRED